MIRIGTGIIPYEIDGVILISSAKRDYKLTVIGGAIENGENALMAARREFREEAGVFLPEFNLHPEEVFCSEVQNSMTGLPDWTTIVYPLCIGEKEELAFLKASLIEDNLVFDPNAWDSFINKLRNEEVKEIPFFVPIEFFTSSFIQNNPQFFDYIPYNIFLSDHIALLLYRRYYAIYT